MIFIHSYFPVYHEHRGLGQWNFTRAAVLLSEEAIRGPKSRFECGALEHCQLMTLSKGCQHEIRLGTDPEEKGAEA
jgi:hypothetical protein